MEKHFTAVIIKSGDWYAGTVKELSGVHSQAKTIVELKENLREAVQLVIDSNFHHYILNSDEYFEEQIAVSL